MVEIVPNLDSTAKHIDTENGKPTKDFFNWMKGVSDRVRQLSDQVDALIAAAGPAGPGAPAAFSVIHSTTQTVGTNVYTQLAFNTELYNIGGHFVLNHWTPPAGKVHLAAAFSADGTTIQSYGVTQAAIFKNGVVRKQGLGISLGTFFSSSHIACDDVANGTDAFTFWVYVQMSSGNATVRSAADQTWFMGHWISP